MFSRPNAALFYVAIAATIVSMGFTSFFGWVGGGGVTAFAILGAAGGILVSGTSPLLWGYVAELQSQRRYVIAGILGAFAALFLFIDAVTNIASVFAMRQIEINRTQNTNLNAENARDQVKRIQKRMAEIRARTNWQTDYLSPEAYDHRIQALKNETERGRNIYKRSKGCSDTTVASSQRVCQAIASAHADKANAIRRLELKTEMDQLKDELVEAKAQVHDTPTVVSAAMTQVRKLTSLATLTLDPTEDMQQIGYLIITGLFGVVMAITGPVCAWALSLMSVTMAAPSAPISHAPYLANYSAASNRPVPDHYANSETTYIIEGGSVTGNSMAHLEALRERIRKKLGPTALEAA